MLSWRALAPGLILAALLFSTVGCTSKSGDDAAGGGGDGASGDGTSAAGGGDESVDADELPLGLDPFLRKGVDIEAEDPIPDAVADLGRFLYFDTRLSRDDSISCATCHHPDHGWADGKAVSTGIEGQQGGVSAPTIINRVFSTTQFWDGRAATLEEQAIGPMTNPIEMGMSSHDVVVSRVAEIDGYKPLFEEAFGDDEVNLDRIATAIAMFERTIVSGNSPYDKYKSGGDESAMSASAIRGMELFFDKARCSICHAGHNFTDEDFHNLGVGMDLEEPPPGRMAVTGKEEDRGKFKTPTLRNIADTAPYMHDGSEKTLLEVVEFYVEGGNPNPNLDKEMKPLELTDQEKQDLVAFMEALSGEVTQVEIPEPVE